MDGVLMVSKSSSAKGDGGAKRRLKVKRRRRGKKRHAVATVAVAAAAAAAKAAIAGVPSKSGDDDSYGSDLETCPADDGFSLDKQASLRPVVVPKAPENSTQFLIDDHENSSFFFNFEHSYKSPSWCGPTDHPAHFFPDDSDADGDADGDADAGDEDVFSSLYYMRDFESEYQNAKEEVLLDWPRETLFSEILRLEERASSLEQMLILQDPHNYINKLQEQLLHLQEENARLRASLRSSAISPARQEADSGGGSAASTFNSSSSSSSSDEDVRCPRRGRRRADTASDLVMVVAPLSLRDSTAPTPSSAATPTQLEEMSIA